MYNWLCLWRCAVKSLKWHQPHRTKEPRLCQLGQKQRDTFKNIFTFYPYINHTCRLEQTLDKRHDTCCIMSLNKARSRSDSPIYLYICWDVIWRTRPTYGLGTLFSSSAHLPPRPFHMSYQPVPILQVRRLL